MLISALTDAPLDVAAKAGYAIELFHNFTLAHDDIMDDAPLRRGKETMYKNMDKIQVFFQEMSC